MVKTVIFDFDGLMVDTEVLSLDFFVELLKNKDVEIDKEFYIKNCSGKKLESSVDLFNEKFNLNFTYEEVAKGYENFEKKYIAEVGISLKPGLKELLKYLREHYIKTIVATSSRQDRFFMILKLTGLDHDFDGYVFGTEVEHGKPAPDIFLKAAKISNTKASEALVLEDSVAGVKAAYRANIPVICVPDMTYPENENECTEVCDSLLDVIDYIDKQN